MKRGITILAVLLIATMMLLGCSKEPAPAPAPVEPEPVAPPAEPEPAPAPVEPEPVEAAPAVETQGLEETKDASSLDDERIERLKTACVAGNAGLCAALERYGIDPNEVKAAAAVEEAPMEETPTEDGAEEAPVEDAPTEDVPAEE
ncbi:hypothetical protein ACFLYT_02115 [Nanoarchaeota archaeon]